MATTNDPYSPNYDPYSVGGEAPVFVPTPYGGPGPFPNYPTNYSTSQGSLGGLSDLLNATAGSTAGGTSSDTYSGVSGTTQQTQPTVQSAMGGSSADQLTTMLESMGLNVGKDLVTNAISQLTGTGTVDLSNLLNAIPGYTAISNIGSTTPTSLGEDALGYLLGNLGTVAGLFSPDNPVLPAMAGTLGGLGSQYISSLINPMSSTAGLFGNITGDVLGNLTTAAGDAAGSTASVAGMPGLSLLTNPGAGMSDFGNVYSSILSNIPVIGQVLGGFLGGILGTDSPTPDWEIAKEGQMSQVDKFANTMATQLGTLVNQEPYKSMLANAQYNPQGWAVPSGWKDPTMDEYLKYFNISPSSWALDPTAPQGAYGPPTGTLADYTPFMPSGISPATTLGKEEINLMNLLGYGPIFQEAEKASFQGLDSPYSITTQFGEGAGGAPTTSYPTETIRPGVTDILRYAGGPGSDLEKIANYIDYSQKAWAGENYGLGTTQLPAGSYLSPLNVNPWGEQATYPWADPYAAAYSALPAAPPTLAPSPWEFSF